MSFVGIREESVDLGTNDNSEIFGEVNVFEPFGRSRLRRSITLGCDFNYGVPGGVWDRLVGFEEVVGERRFFPPRVVFSRLVVSESEVGHRSFLISSSFLRLCHSDFQAQVILAVLIMAARELR